VNNKYFYICGRRSLVKKFYAAKTFIHITVSILFLHFKKKIMVFSMVFLLYVERNTYRFWYLKMNFALCFVRLLVTENDDKIWYRCTNIYVFILVLYIFKYIQTITHKKIDSRVVINIVFYLKILLYNNTISTVYTVGVVRIWMCGFRFPYKGET
jgi:hypothetical protein